MAHIYARDPLNMDNMASPVSGRRLTPKLFIYDAIIELMLNEPNLTLKEIALRVQRSPAFMSYTVHTDHFRDLYARRRAERNQMLNMEIAESLQRVAKKSLDVLDKKLDNAAALNAMQAKDITDTVLQRLGYGIKAPVESSVNVQTNIALSAEDFHHAQNVVRAVENSTGLVYKPELSTPVVATKKINEVPKAPRFERDLDDILDTTLPASGIVEAGIVEAE